MHWGKVASCLCVALVPCCEVFQGLAKREQRDVGISKQGLVQRVKARPSDEIWETSKVFAGKQVTQVMIWWNRILVSSVAHYVHEWEQTQGNMQINNEILNVQASGAQAWRGPLRTFGNWMWKRMSGRRVHPKPLGIAKTRIWKMMCKQTSQCEERWIWNLKKWVDVGTILNHSGLQAKKSMVLNVTLRNGASGSWIKGLAFCNETLRGEVSI